MLRLHYKSRKRALIGFSVKGMAKANAATGGLVKGGA
jgi:hypothetical protein